MIVIIRTYQMDSMTLWFNSMLYSLISNLSLHSNNNNNNNRNKQANHHKVMEHRKEVDQLDLYLLPINH